jgi:hypothetical protein
MPMSVVKAVIIQILTTEAMEGAQAEDPEAEEAGGEHKDVGGALLVRRTSLRPNLQKSLLLLGMESSQWQMLIPINQTTILGPPQWRLVHEQNSLKPAQHL